MQELLSLSILTSSLGMGAGEGQGGGWVVIRIACLYVYVVFKFYITSESTYILFSIESCYFCFCAIVTFDFA